MAHASTETPLKDHDDPEPGATWFIGLAGAIVFTALVLGLSVLYYGTDKEQVDHVVVDRSSAELTRHLAEQTAKLQEYGRYKYTDPDGKTSDRVRIPIEEAMAIVVKEGFGK